MRKLLVLTLSLAACASTKAPVTDDFSSLAGSDDKSDSFSKSMKLVGSLSYGDTSSSVSYTSTPKYRAFKFGGAKGDTVDLWVRSTNGGDAVTWLLDNNFKTLASNDDADDTTLDSHITATLPGNSNPDIITYYIVFRDYWQDSAKFKVSLSGKPVDFFACNVDSDCVSVPVAACCNNGYKIAVNKGEVKAYDAANACTNPHPICPLYVINDTRIAECNFSTHECEMIQPGDVHCGGNITPTHKCSTGYQCQLGHIPDTGGTCVACAAYQHYDSTGTCVDNPHCGGIAGIACPKSYSSCVDDPRDSCDPNNGGADCGGICE